MSRLSTMKFVYQSGRHAPFSEIINLSDDKISSSSNALHKPQTEFKKVCRYPVCINSLSPKILKRDRTSSQ